MTKYITIEGLFESNVLGIFSLIRGFANLKDLAAISTPFTMEDAAQAGRVVGHQRQLDENHAQRIKTYLERSDNRFLPEVILSIRIPFEAVNNNAQVQIGVSNTDQNGIIIRRKFASQSNKVHQIHIERKKIQTILQNKLIRRIDGNHRLALADQLVDDPALPNKYTASFCLILLGPTYVDADDYSESLIFHTINSKALPLESEHALTLLLGQNPDHAMIPEVEFAYDPSLHMTRLLRDQMAGLPGPARERMGHKPLTVLGGAARSMVKMDAHIVENRENLQRFSRDVFAGISDVITILSRDFPELCSAEYFLDLAARVWKKFEDGTHGQRVSKTTDYLKAFGHWIGREGIIGLKTESPLSEQLLKTYESVRNQIPKKVFLARWYPKIDEGEHKHRADLRLEQIEVTLKTLHENHNIFLELVDMGTEEGATFPIHEKMYEAIESSDIIVIDLTGIRPNVCIEAGFALRSHERERLIFLNEKYGALPDVPFDLTTFKYESVTQAAEIPGKLIPQIKKILERV